MLHIYIYYCDECTIQIHYILDIDFFVGGGYMFVNQYTLYRSVFGAGVRTFQNHHMLHIYFSVFHENKLTLLYNLYNDSDVYCENIYFHHDIQHSLV